MKLKEHLPNLRKFFFESLWSTKLKDIPRKRRHLYIFLRIWIITFDEFKKDRITEKASNLTYFTLLSIVPVIAMAFGISKGFGLKGVVEKQMESFITEKAIREQISGFAEKMIDSANGGVVAGIGLVVLLYLVMRLLTNIEVTFNVMWDIKKNRPIHRKLSDYISVMILGVLLIVMSSSTTVYIHTEIDKLGSPNDYNEIKSGVIFLIKLVPYALIWLLLFLLYLIFPNTRVKVGPALIAGIVAGSAYQVTQWAFIEFNFVFSRYNDVYGGLAILPLFIIYIQLSWFIVLIGAELAYAMQYYNIWVPDNDRLKLSLRHKRKMALIVMYRIIKRFNDGESPISISQLSAMGSVPSRFISDVCYELERANLINRIESEKGEDFFQPAFDIQKMTIMNVLNKFESIGANDFDNTKSEAFIKIEDSLKEMDELFQTSNANVLLKDL